tara:strand:- start:12824 stop:13162 length:339 start_codon:yes stop_codon:yes gene_type:complete
MTRAPTEMETRVAEAIKFADYSKPTGGLGATYLSLARAAIRALKEPSHTVTSSLGVEPSHVLYTIKDGSIPSGGVGNSGGGGGRIHTYNIEPNTTHYVTIGAGGAKTTQEPT